MKRVLIYTERSNQLNLYINDKKSKHVVMGEIILFTSTINILSESYSCLIVKSLQEFVKNDIDVIYYIVDYITLPKVKHMILNEKNLKKVFLFCYWGRHCIRDEWTHNNLGLPLDQILVPFPNLVNTFIGFYVTPCKEIIIKYNLSIGLLWCKEYWHVDEALLGFFEERNIPFYATCKTSINFKNIYNVGLLDRLEYQRMLKEMKFVLGFGSPPQGPTIIEALFNQTFIICPSNQLHASHIGNPNIIITDGKSHEEILYIICQICNGSLRFDENFIPMEYSWNQHKQRVSQIFHL